MNSPSAAAIDRMQFPLRTIGLGLLIASAAMPVRAQPKIPHAAPPMNAATAQPSTSLNLTLPPVTTLPPILLDPALQSATTPPSIPLDPALQSASAEVKSVARWVIDSGDSAHLPFLLIDKVNAQVFAFNPAGQLQGATPALLGMARGDRLLAPNSATMEQMPPQVRITPAGRFVSRLAIDSHGKELLVLDYDASISLHAVLKGTPEERRAERLKSATSQDNRISFGCINVPAAFYTMIVSPAFTHTKGVVYVLPETGPAGELFGFQATEAGAPVAQQGQPALQLQPARTVPGSVAR